MLILSRKPGESIVIDGRITVTVVRLAGDAIKLGISAPAEVPVHRQEIYEEIQKNNLEALTNNRSVVPRFAANGRHSRPVPPATSSPAAIPPKHKVIIPTTRK